ncbi:MAG: nucleoside kinase [Alistipes sp.]|nr:nucleoside kinase [Alistipes sp.]MBO5972236.1 nucleoside kinase [Alistipes sp.]
MAHTIELRLLNNSSQLNVEVGSSLMEVLQNSTLEQPYPFIAARVNNVYKGLGYRIYKPVTVEYFDLRDFEGYRVYQRTLSFVLQKASHDIFPERKLRIRHSLGNGFYAEYEDRKPLCYEDATLLKLRMEAIVAENIPISHSRRLAEEVVAEYKEYGFDDRIELLDTRPHLYRTVNHLGDMPGYFYGVLAPSTGYVKRFDIIPYYNGFYVAIPARTNPEELTTIIHHDKMFDIFHEYQQWIDIMGVPTIGDLNRRVLEGDASELIKIAEAFHELKIASIARSIAEANSERGVRMVLISGPSSSGKTTFSKRIGVQLRVRGYDPVLIALDDYFVDRDKTPLDESGKPDFEALEAIDLVTLNDHLKRLTAGESVEIPRYDFITGKRQWHEKPLQLTDRSILILEGIHALNPRLTQSVPDGQKFKIYISCFTSVSMDNSSRIPTTDNRLLRRSIRDNATRGHSLMQTFSMWPSVRRGEEKHIFPYQENANVMFNSSLFYEISVLKAIAEPLLREVPDTAPEHAEACRLLKLLEHFVAIDPDEIPPTSLLREFIGGSSFKY